MPLSPDVDIALVLEEIRPGALWRDASSYDSLKKTWEDDKPREERTGNEAVTNQAVPTEQDIQNTWDQIVKQREEEKQKTKEVLVVIGNPNEALLALLEAEGATATGTKDRTKLDALIAKVKAEKTK